MLTGSRLTSAWGTNLELKVKKVGRKTFQIMHIANRNKKKEILASILSNTKNNILALLESFHRLNILINPKSIKSNAITVPTIKNYVQINT